MAEKPIHYSGGVLYATGAQGCTEMLPGWPACCSGPRAEKIARASEQTTDIEHVTCAKCRSLWQRTRDDHLELHAHQRTFEGRFAIRNLSAVDLMTLGQVIEPIDQTLRVRLADKDHAESGARKVDLTPREAYRLGSVRWRLARSQMCSVR